MLLVRNSLILVIAALLTVVAPLAACSPLTTLNVVTSRSGYNRSVDIAYADGARQKLDVYVPKNESNGLRPVVVFFYGGGWETGRRERYRFVAKALTGEGFVVVIPDYRVYPEAVFPGFVLDGARAARWTKDQIARFGGDPQRIFVMGHSAGAHIAALLALDAEYLNTVSMAPSDLRGMIGLAGPYDFLPLRSERLQMIFGPEPQRWRTQPINFVDGKNPPMLLMTGDQDSAVPPRNTRALAAKIRAHNGAVRTVEYPGVGHGELLTRLVGPFGTNGEVLSAIAEFIQQHSRTPAIHSPAKTRPSAD